MANNPFIAHIPDVAKRIMPTRTALVPGGGVPAGECLNNWMPAELVEGALCMVRAQNEVYQFDKFSMTAPAGATCVATMAGAGVPGRWKVVTANTTNVNYRAITYDNMAAVPLSPSVWTPFSGGSGALATDITGTAGLVFDGTRSIVAQAAMVVKVKFFISYSINNLDMWGFAAMKNGAGGTPQGYATDHMNVPATEGVEVFSVATGCTIVSLAQNDTLELMAIGLGATTDSSVVSKYATLTVHSLP